MDDIDSFFDNLEDDLNDTILQEVVPIVEEVVHEKSTDIYDEFTPTMYERRYENNIQGSFGDREMITTQTVGSIKSGEINLITTNDSLANGSDKGNYLDDIIEDGERYTWSHKPPARPFAERAIEELHESNKIENAIERGMKSKGYNIK
jgi:hypothetical protein